MNERERLNSEEKAIFFNLSKSNQFIFFLLLFDQVMKKYCGEIH